MKRYLSYIVFVVLSIAVIGCTKTETDSISSEVGQLTLQFSNRALTTRAAGAADDDHNEDLIKSVQLFFYTSNSDSEAAVYALKKEINLSDFNEGKPNTTLSLIIPAGDMNTLFPNGATSCYIYAVANYTDLTTSKPSVVDIKAKELEADFSVGQESFVMDGDLVKISKSGNTLTAEKTIELTRAAAKIELTVNVTNLTINNETWEANTANMKVSLFNGVKKGLIDDGSDNGATVDHNGDYFNVEDRTFSSVESSTTQFKQSVPFYSYTTRWEANAEDEVYLKLSIPWRVKTADAEAYQTYYYLIPVNMDGKSLVRNSFYKITLDVKALGGQSEPITVEPSYVVLDWSTGEVNVDLSRPKYLVVDENYVTMNNVNSYSVAYQSSDRITAVITSIIKPNLSGDTATYPNIIDTNHGFSISTTGENGGVITLNHTLQNDNTRDNYDYVPYTVTVEVTMTVGTSTFKETIVFTQYPAMYITADQNTDYTDGSSTSDKYGYVFLNGNRYSSSGWGGSYTGGGSYWGSITGLSGNNANPNMYVINVSSLDSNDYLIGDPRCLDGSETVSLGGNESWDSAPNLSSGQTVTGPQNYLPTSANTPTVIAPKFRIASSYGKTSGITFAAAKKRCASYQEDGFPAGRWRVPTKAEIAYITKLSAKDYIPILFNNGGNYWNASGTITSPNNDTGEVSEKTSGSNVFVRCVYDEWYWSDKCDINTFTWGDAPRPTN